MAFLLTFTGGGSATYKDAVRVARDTQLALTGSTPLTVDGVTLADKDRVLLRGQTAGAENGIYVAAISGGSYILSRAKDADTDKEVLPNMLVPVAEGSTNVDKIFQLVTNAPIVVGSTSLVFSDVLIGLANKADRDLANLLPTSINQSLLFADDTSYNIGASSASRPQTLYVKTAINLNSLTASQVLAADASKNLVSSGVATTDMSTSVSATQAATDLSTASTLVKRDASGQTSLDGLNLDGSVSGAISLQAANTTTGYTVKMPAAQGAASTYLQNDGSGNLSWASISLLPSQTGNLDKVLVTDGTSASWQYAGLGAGALGTNNVVVGRSKPASMAGTDNTVIGAGAATALIGANRVVCIGSGSGTLITSGNQSVVIGAYASSPSTSAFNVVVGDGASCSSSDSIAIGRSASASNQYAIAIGDLTVAASRTVSVGSRISGGGTFSVAVGKDISNAGTSSIVFGHGASDRGESNVLAIGSGNSGVINTVYLGLGAAYQTSANAVKIMTMRASGTTDTNMSAGALTLAASQGTGTGAGGDVIISTAPAAGVTGSTTNAHVERIRAKSAGEVVVNDTGVDFDFRVEGDNDANLVFVDASTDRVGIGTATPAQKLDVNGTAQATAFQVPNYILSPQLYNEGTKTGNFTLDFANGPCQQVTINAAGPLVITLSNPVTGGAYLIKIVQGTTTGTVTWPAAVKWGTAGAPVLSTTTGLIDIINLYYDGTNYYGTYALGF